MKSQSKNDWKPISQRAFEELLERKVAQLTPNVRKTFDACVTGITEQSCQRREQYGLEHVFVVAQSGARLLFFDDVEDEFAVASPGSDGVLRNWSTSGPLSVAISHLREAAPDRDLAALGGTMPGLKNIPRRRPR
jgi:hypothetical protein